MSKWIYNYIHFLVLLQLIKGHEHYRCGWFPHQDGADKTKSSNQCSSQDSLQMTSYINHCTRQSYVPLVSCDSTGHWNCQSLRDVCKTLLRNEELQPQAPSFPKLAAINAESDPVLTPPKFNPNENYFTMKEMGVAVLVSFIAGATMLAIVIIVIWRCRNSSISTEQRIDSVHKDAKTMAALHAITQLATVFGAGHDGQNHQHGVSNPNYAQIISSNELLDDILSDHERVYEEIFARRRSSCIHPECIYATVEKKKKGGVRKIHSQNNLEVIDEHAEQGTSGDDANNSSVHFSVKKLNNISPPPLPSSPRIGITRNAVRYNVNSSEKELDIASDSDTVTKWNKYDSGYEEEMFDSGLATVNIDERLVETNGGQRNPLQTSAQ